MFPTALPPPRRTPFRAARGLLPALLLAAAPLRAQTVPALDDALQQQLSALARQAAGRQDGQPARIEVELGRLDPRLTLAPCQRIEPYLPAGLPAWGRTRIGLRCVQGSKLWNVSLPLTVRVFRPAQVLRDPLPAGTVLEASHLTEEEVDIAAAPGAAILEPERALGRTLARPLQAGATLRVTDLKARQWFGPGQVVRVVARGDGWQISAEGQAMTAGVEGQLARIRMEGGKQVVGRPVGEGLVEINP